MKKLTAFCSAWMVSALAATAALAAEPPAAYGPTPTPTQVRWNSLGYYGFCHLTVNTFTNREWGYGDEDPNLFNPTDFDARQMVRAFKAGGMKAVIVTAKHHDGFCLWQTAYSDHSVKSSSWKGGKGDVVREFADACKAEGMMFGVYLSPWDRNRADYATPAYIQYYRNQLRELLTNYGTISFVWLDGANGGDGYYGGAKEKRKIPDDYYDWPTTVKMIHELQPKAIINSANDYRWVGNERGNTPDPCWSTVNSGSLFAAADWRKTIGTGVHPGQRWCGAETDVSIIPSWFWHADQAAKVKTPTKLLQMYYDAVGHGQCLILNMPPNQRGQIDDAEVASVTKAGDVLKQTFANNLAAGATLTASNVRGNDPKFAADKMLAGDDDSYWATDDSEHTPSVTVDFGKATTFDVVRFGEYIPLGQRIEGVTLEAWQNDGWTKLADAPNVGYERLIRLKQPATATKIRVTITQSPVAVTLRNLGVFLQPAIPQ